MQDVQDDKDVQEAQEAQDARGQAHEPAGRDDRSRTFGRTDELELISSSLTIFALFTLPGIAIDRLADIYTHLSFGFVIASMIVSQLLTGACYALGSCFVVHLMVRAYWVGLIGLQRAFPEGIDWNRTGHLGPVTREHYRATLPAHQSLVDRTDRIASSLFAIISMLTLYLLWFGVVMAGVLVAAGVLGAEFGLTNAALNVGSAVLLLLFAVVPLLAFVLDALIATRVQALRESQRFVLLLALLRRLSGLAYPRRLIVPVQLTLQSNTRPFLFYAVLALSVLGIVLVGDKRVQSWREFTVSDAFTFLGEEELYGGLVSTHYEDMPSSEGRFEVSPRVTSFTQRGSFMQVFLPYWPVRDDLVLQLRCGEPEASEAKVDCLRGLWSVSLEDRAFDMSTFIAAQRADLGMRGLIGAVSLGGLEPGMHALNVVWNPDPIEFFDDRYDDAELRFSIPFVFAPEFERALD